MLFPTPPLHWVTTPPGPDFTQCRPLTRKGQARMFVIELAELLQDIELVFGEVEDNLYGLESEGGLFSHARIYVLCNLLFYK